MIPHIAACLNFKQVDRSKNLCYTDTNAFAQSNGLRLIEVGKMEFDVTWNLNTSGPSTIEGASLEEAFINGGLTEKDIPNILAITKRVSTLHEQVKELFDNNSICVVGDKDNELYRCLCCNAEKPWTEGIGQLGAVSFNLVAHKSTCRLWILQRAVEKQQPTTKNNEFAAANHQR
jgi:hypothetical protein